MLQILNVFSQTKSKETGKIYIVDILVEKNHGVKKRKIVISQHFLRIMFQLEKINSLQMLKIQKITCFR